MSSTPPAKGGFTVAEDQPLPVTKSNNTHRRKVFLISQALARFLAMASSFVALALILNTRDSVYIFGVKFDAYYTYSAAFRYLMVVDAVVGSFAAVSLGSLCLFALRPAPSARRFFYLFLHDLLVLLVMMSGCSAASAVGYVGKYGEEKMGWMPLCDRITRFCNRITVSISFSFVAMLCFLALTLSSASNLMSRFPQ